jgi:hypothetical protein
MDAAPVAPDADGPPDSGQLPDGGPPPLFDATIASCRLMVSNAEGGPCSAEVLPCAGIGDSFSCRPNVCRCVGGRIRCEDTRPGSFGGRRECLAGSSCAAEGRPVCDNFKPWTLCRCTDDGTWLCQDECQRRGCPAGPYGGAGGVLHAHTGEACTGTQVCPYGGPSPTLPGFSCTCVSGRFQCTGEPPDAGARD